MPEAQAIAEEPETATAWVELVLPAIAERDEGWRKVGDPLWPSRYSKEWLAEQRRDIGGWTWTALYQQRPSAAGGTIFKREWWKRYDERPEQWEGIVFSLDTAFKKGQHNDWTVNEVWGRRPEGFYLLMMWRERVEFPELKKRTIAMDADWQPNAVLIEDKASGQSLIQELQRETTIPVLPRPAETDLQMRASGVSPLVEAGNCYLPRSAPWLPEFEDEVANFPFAPFNDTVASLVQVLEYFRAGGGGPFMSARAAEPADRKTEDEEGYVPPSRHDQFRRNM